MRIIINLFLIMFLSACSAKWPHALHQARANINNTKAGRLLVVVRDTRNIPNFVPEAYRPFYAGILKQAFGDPIPVLTADGLNLSTSLGQAICASFTVSGWACESAESVSKVEIRREVGDFIKRHVATKILYINVKQWETSIATQSEVAYDFNLTLWNRSGHLLGSVGEQGSRPLPLKSMLNPAENAARGVPEALADILSGLLNEPQLVARL